VTGNLLRDVNPTAYGHRPLCEVPEFMRQHRFEFTKAEHIDDGKPDLEILS
jgi:hypothetical protein